MKTILAILFLLAFASGGSLAEQTQAALFRTNCSGCHGVTGKADNTIGQQLELLDLASKEVQKKTDAELTEVITKGGRRMPGYQGKLHPEEVARLVSFIRSLPSNHGCTHASADGSRISAQRSALPDTKKSPQESLSRDCLVASRRALDAIGQLFMVTDATMTDGESYDKVLRYSDVASKLIAEAEAQRTNMGDKRVVLLLEECRVKSLNASLDRMRVLTLTETPAIHLPCKDKTLCDKFLECYRDLKKTLDEGVLLDSYEWSQKLPCRGTNGRGCWQSGCLDVQINARG
jgi:mono/diheme cytochrome c family protein